MSRPAWARGLKQPKSLLKPFWPVAPRVGAWIETEQVRRDIVSGSRAPRGRVD